MKTISLSLLAASGLLLTGMQGHAQAADPDDGFDALYGKRIELFTKQLAIYESVVDRPSAEEAAKTAPKALELVGKWESEAEAFDALGPEAANTAQKLHGEMKTEMGKLVMTVMQLNGNKALSEPLQDVLQRIMKAMANV